MYSRIRSAVCVGIEGREVYVETDISRGLPGIGITGLPSTMVMEARERLRSAILNSGFEYPKGRITVNLIPASLRKNSSCLDLPIAVGILACRGSFATDMTDSWGMIGELSLDGRVLGVKGALPMMLHMRDIGIKGIIVPRANRNEAMLAGGNVFAVNDLRECIGLLCRDPETISGLAVKNIGMIQGAEDAGEGEPWEDCGDFSEIAGQENAKRAMVIAAAGRHGLLMIGSPGCGKTMLAGRMTGIMPEMDDRERLENAVIRSITGNGHSISGSGNTRPFRDPHHSIGRAGLIGGGSVPVPGEITLAHNGVLFLDEVCEFRKETIEALRIPLEEKKITHFRKGESYTFPCNFQVVMAANPCPCGYLGDKDRECSCTQADIDRYRRKLSGPLLDRIDMSITMKKVEYDDLTGGNKGLATAEMQAMVKRALEFSAARGQESANAELTESEVERYCRLGPGEKRFMKQAYETFSMSPRSYIRTLRIARTIADLDESESITQTHLAEALGYRLQEDRNG